MNNIPVLEVWMGGERVGRLSPAFDLLPSDGFNGFHTTTVNGNGNPTEDDMLAVAAAAGIAPRRAREIITEIRAICAA